MLKIIKIKGFIVKQKRAWKMANISMIIILVYVILKINENDAIPLYFAHFYNDT